MTQTHIGKADEVNAMEDLAVVGKGIPRIDGPDKITGAAEYVDDMDFGPGLLHAAVVESPHGYARIIGIDTSRAEAEPGVVKVVTGKDFPFTFGMYMKDRYVFAQDVVRFAGEQVAALTIITGSEGTAVLSLQVGTEARELTVIVGAPLPGDVPPVLAPAVGVEVNE